MTEEAPFGLTREQFEEALKRERWEKWSGIRYYIVELEKCRKEMRQIPKELPNEVLLYKDPRIGVLLNLGYIVADLFDCEWQGYDEYTPLKFAELLQEISGEIRACTDER